MKRCLSETFESILLDTQLTRWKGRGFRSQEGQHLIVHTTPDQAGCFKKAELPCPLCAQGMKFSVTTFRLVRRGGDVALPEGRNCVIERGLWVLAAFAGHQTDQTEQK